MKHDNDIDKLLRDAADNFELPYEDAHWAEFQQMQAATKTSFGSKFLSFLKTAKWLIIATVTVTSTGIYFALNHKEPVIADKQEAENPVVLENPALIAKPKESVDPAAKEKLINKEFKSESKAEKPNKKEDNNTAIVKSNNSEHSNEASVTKPVTVVKPIIEKKIKHNENAVEIVSPKATITKRSARKSAKKAEKSTDEIYMFPQSAANAVDVATISKRESEKPREPIEPKRGTIIDNKKDNVNKVYEDFVVDETPVDPPKSEPVPVKKEEKVNSQNALSDTIFERNLTSTAFVAKEDSKTEKLSAVAANNLVAANEEPAKLPVNHEFSVDVFIGAAFYQALYANTSGAAINNADDSYNAGLFVGAKFEYTLSNKLSVYIQPVYQQRGSINISDTVLQTVYGFGKSENTFILSIDKLHYIEVPVGIGFKVFDKHKIYAGVGISYLTSTSARMKQFDDKEAKVQTGSSNGINEIDYYVMLAYQYEVIRRLRLFAQMQFAPSTVTDKKYYPTGLHNSNTTLKVGLSIRLFNTK